MVTRPSDSGAAFGVADGFEIESRRIVVAGTLAIRAPGRAWRFGAQVARGWSLRFAHRPFPAAA